MNSGTTVLHCLKDEACLVHCLNSAILVSHAPTMLRWTAVLQCPTVWTMNDINPLSVSIFNSAISMSIQRQCCCEQQGCDASLLERWIILNLIRFIVKTVQHWSTYANNAVRNSLHLVQTMNQINHVLVSLFKQCDIGLHTPTTLLWTEGSACLTVWRMNHINLVPVSLFKQCSIGLHTRTTLLWTAGFAMPHLLNDETHKLWFNCTICSGALIP